MKTTFLLGAGAMIPFGGPSTEELTNLVLCDKKCKLISNNLVGKFGSQVNFESILACIEQLLDWKMAHEYYSNELISNELLEPAIHYWMSMSAIDLHALYCNAIDNVIERIRQYDLYNCVEYDRSKIRHILLEYLKNAMNHSELNVYTLNYDRLIPKLFQDNDVVYEGIRNSEYEFDYKKFFSHTFTYFNLHGSIYLDCDNNKKVQLTEIPINLRKNNLLKGGNPGEVKFFSPIITGYSKSQRMLSNPFNFGIGAFMYDCNICDRLMIIGYSFGDPHINSIIDGFVKKGETDIVIVDYSDDLLIPPNATYYRVGILPIDFKEQNSGVFYNSKCKTLLYLKGFSNYINDELVLSHNTY